MANKRNGVISIWKFIFSLLIMSHHFIYIRGYDENTMPFLCGSIGVDFFFIVSGYLMAKKVFSEERAGDTRSLGKATWDFIRGKIKGFYLYLVIAFVVYIALSYYFGTMTPETLVKAFNDLTLLMMSGTPETGYLGGAWYLSSMVLAMLVLYPLLKKYKKTFTQIIAPIVAIFVGGYMCGAVGNLRYVKAWMGVVLVGIGKAVFEICAGCFAYEISERLRKVNFTAAGRALLSAAVIVTFGGVLYENSFRGDTREYDWLFILMIFAGVAIAFSGKTALHGICCNKLFFFLEKASLVIYLNNFIWVRMANYFGPFQSLDMTWKCIVAIAGNVIFSIIEFLVVEWLRKKLAPLCARLKGIFISQNGLR